MEESFAFNNVQKEFVVLDFTLFTEKKSEGEMKSVRERGKKIKIERKCERKK